MILDLFAGPGGWDVALGMLGLAPVVGIEWDRSACLTRAAAGHLTIRASVADYPTAPFVGKVKGVIASPPCPTFSAAGKGDGRDELPQLHAAAERIAKWGWVDPYQHHAWGDPRTPLVLEPLRWVAALRPEWVTCEQVPAVLPLWEQYAGIWQEAGYSVWAGVLEAERYGVPQTRERAFVIASRVSVAQPPEPTHQRYVAGIPQGHGCEGLFGAVVPWVSMADALGWGMTARPGLTMAPGTSGGGADAAGLGGSGARRSMERERESLATEGHGASA